MVTRPVAMVSSNRHLGQSEPVGLASRREPWRTV